MWKVIGRITVITRWYVVCVEIELQGPWPLIDIDKIPLGIVAVDVKIVEETEEYESIMLAGHTGYEVLEDGCTLKPQIGWCICLKMTADEVEKLHETARGKDQWSCDQCGSYLME
ncbi:hypothetical protein HA402_013046 [Bradysia odoriphaga]|nr:hypothetical protein HA402_013046 [Bradysia odoriphaga]